MTGLAMRRRFLVILAGFFVLTYPGLLAGTRTLFFRDFGVISYPILAYQHDNFWRGEWPLWDSLSHCGVPFCAQWGAMSFYPFSLIYLLLPLPWGLSIFWMAHLYLGGIGMYRLAGSYTKAPFAASVAGLIYVFSGLVFSSLAWPNYSVALGWMPWVVLLSEKAVQKGGRTMAFAALAGALQMLSGVPEIVLLTWGFIALLLLREIRGTGSVIFEGSAISPEAQVNRASRSRLCLRFALLVIWIAAICAAQLFPFFDLLSRSQRDVNFGTTGWSMPGWGWAGLFAPLFHCAQSPQGVYYQPRHVFITSYYLGLGCVTLAAFGARATFPRKAVLLLATSVGLILAMGDDGFLFPLLKQALPQLGFGRFPIKFFYLAAFCLPLLAAHGVDSVLSARNHEDTRRRFAWALGLAGAFVGLIVLWAKFFPFPTDHWAVMAVNSLERVVLLALAGGGVLWAARPMSESRRVFAEVIVLGALWLDAVAYAPHLIPTLPSEAFARDEAPMHPAPQTGVARAMVSAYAEEHLYASRVPDFLNDYVGKRLALWANLNLIDRIPKVDGALTLQMREEAEIETVLHRSSTNGFPGLLDFLGVSQVTAPKKIVDWQERKTARPWITAGQQAVLVPSGHTLEAVLAPAFDPSRQVVLETGAGGAIGSLAYQPATTVSQATFASDQVEAQAESPSPTLLVIAQSYHPNWRARLDGNPVELLRANHAFQAVMLPAGKHILVLRYEDKWLALGSLVSILALVVAVVFVIKKAPER